MDDGDAGGVFNLHDGKLYVDVSEETIDFCEIYGLDDLLKVHGPEVNFLHIVSDSLRQALSGNCLFIAAKLTS